MTRVYKQLCYVLSTYITTLYVTNINKLSIKMYIPTSDVNLTNVYRNNHVCVCVPARER